MSVEDSSSSNPHSLDGVAGNSASAPGGNGSTHGLIDLSSNESVASFNATLVEVNQEIAAQGVTLNKQSRSQLAKWRSKAEQVVPLIFDLGQRYGVALPHYSVTQGQQDLACVLRLLPLSVTAVALSQVVRDNVLAKESAVWQAAVTIYGMLSTLANRTPELEGELILVRNYFAPKKPKKASVAAMKQKAKAGHAGSGPSAAATPGASVAPAGAVPNHPAIVVERRQRHEVRQANERRVA